MTDLCELMDNAPPTPWLLKTAKEFNGADWPMAFWFGNDAVDGYEYVLTTDSVRGSEMPIHSSSDIAKFTQAAVNALPKLLAVVDAGQAYVDSWDVLNEAKISRKTDGLHAICMTMFIAFKEALGAWENGK